MNHSSLTVWVTCISLTGAFASSTAAQQVVYVDKTATGAGTGSSWVDAYSELRDALAVPGAEIWVAAGTYAPALPGGNRDTSFVLQTGQAVFGGFAGTETLRTDRDPLANPTILTGDLNGDDPPGWGNMGENSHHVIRAIGVTDVILDGVTVTRGYAWQSSGINGIAAGMYSTNSTLTLNDCTFAQNLSHSGAGLYLYESPATVSNCVFTGNYALGGNGGGIYHGANSASPTAYTLTVTNSKFLNNTAHQNGGAQGHAAAIYSYFNAPVLVDGCLFEGNVATWRFTYGSYDTLGGAMLIHADGGAIKNSIFRSNWAMAGGAVYSFGDTDFSNCLFASNEAKRFSVAPYDFGGFGGAIVAGGISNITNCTFHANKSRNVGGVWASPDVTITNSILWTNIATEVGAPLIDQQIQGNPMIRNSCIRGLFQPLPGEDPPDPTNFPGTLDMDPIFVDVDGADGILGNADDDIRLSFGSPCIDAADNTAVPTDITADIDGNPRYFDDPTTVDNGVGPAPVVDMGAFEFGTWVDPGANQLPTADFAYEVNGAVGSFEDLSKDNDGSIVEWIWDFGDYTSSTVPNPQHTYQRNGIYEISLVVRDDVNGTDRSVVRSIAIVGIPNLSVDIVDPTYGATVSDIVPVTATTTNDQNVTQVKFFVDGVQFGKATNPPFTISWNTNLGSDGSHTLTAKATDISEAEVVSPPVVANVDNATPLITSSPFDVQIDVGTGFGRTIAANGNPSPTFSIVTAPIGMTMDAATGAMSFTPTADQLGGPHAVVVRAENTLGFDEQTSQVTVVDTTAPSVPTGLTAGNVTETTALLSWVASTDNVAVSHYDVYRWRRVNRFVKGFVLHIPGVTGTSVTVTATSSSHRYYVRAIDTSGNSSWGSPVITVQFYSAPWIYHNPIGEVFATQTGVLGMYAINSGGFPAPTYELIGAPVGMIIDAITGRISWAPTEGQIGSGSVTVRGTSVVGFDELLVNYAVTLGPDTAPPSTTPPPTITGITAFGADLAWTAATDDRGVAGYLIKGQEAGAGTLVFNIADSVGLGTTYTVSTLNPGTTYDIWISAYDAAGNQAPIAGIAGASLSTLPPPVSPPTITITGDVAVVEGGPSVTGPVATVSDVIDSPGSLLVSVSGAPVGITVSVSNLAGTVSAVASAACGTAAGSHAVTLSVTDSDLFVVTASLDVVVSANTAPTLGAYAATTVAAVDSVSVVPTVPPADTNGAITSITVDPVGLPISGSLTVEAATGVVSVATVIDTVVGDYPVTVTATDSCGATTMASFLLTVGACTVPAAATTPTPADLSTDTALETQLSWDGGPPAPVHCPNTFDVYFDTVDPPLALLASGLTTPTVATGPLAEVTTYYWQVVTSDCCGQATGPVWSFSTQGVPRLMVDTMTLEYSLAPGTSQLNQILLTNVGTASATWRVADLPVPAGQPLTARQPVAEPRKNAPNVAPDWTKDHVPNSLIVGFRTQPVPNARNRGRTSARIRSSIEEVRVQSLRRQQIHEACGTTVAYSCQLTPVDIVQVPPQSNLRDVAVAYAARPEVAYVEPNYIWTTALAPDDPSYGSLWGMNNAGQTGGSIDADIDAPEAWDVTTGSRDIIVAVIDTGIDYNHPELAANMWTNAAELNGISGVDDDANGIVDDIYGARWTSGTGVATNGNPFDDHFHGTHVAGTIGALGNNTLGVVGVNWNVSLMALKFLNSAGSGTTADAIAAVDYAVAQGAHLTSNSWGGGAFSIALKNAIDAAGAAGQLFVAAAGNSARNADISPMYPAAYDSPTILSVAAINHLDERSWFSNWGALSVDLAAPGSDILSTSPGGTYRTISGTSMATPHVSGVAALVLSRNPALPVLELKQKLMDSVELIPSMAGLTVTGGRVNAAKAIEGLAWLTIFPRNGVMAPGQSTLIDVTADATGLVDGFFDAGLLRFTGGDPAGPTDVSAGLSVGTTTQCVTDVECDDGLFCNGAEVCLNRFCRSGISFNCDDGIGCTVDSCVEATQSCQSVVDDALCDNGVFCDGAEVCDVILGCLAGTPVFCDDGIGCTTDFCDAVTDSCQGQPDDLLCDNGIFCDGVEVCDTAFGCQPTAPVNCDDGIGCTIDACDEATALCYNVPNDIACDNGLFCDGIEVCDVALGCGPGSDPCAGQPCDEQSDMCVGCLVDADCDDGLFCNGLELCDVLGQCRSGIPADCNDGITCTTDSCDGVTDRCVHIPSDLACNDGLICNGAETCDALLDCQVGTPMDCGGLADQCNTGACDEASAACVANPIPDGQACSNGDACPGDTCLGGLCDPIPCSGTQPPTGFAGVFDQASRLTWNAVTDPDTAMITIYRAGVSGGPYSIVAVVDGGDTNYDDEPGNGLFCYVITLMRDGIESGFSNEICGTVDVGN